MLLQWGLGKLTVRVVGETLFELRGYKVGINHLGVFERWRTEEEYSSTDRLIK